MALSADDFTRPKGRLREEWFPEDDLPALLQGWIDVAEEKSGSEKAQALYVNWRAYEDVADRLHAEWAREDFDDVGGRQRLQEQLRYFQAKARAYKADYQSATGARKSGLRTRTAQREQPSSEYSARGRGALTESY